MPDWVTMQMFKDLNDRVARLEKLCEGFLRHTHPDGHTYPGAITGEEAVRRSIEAQEADRDE